MRGALQSFEDMPVWQKAMEIAVSVFELTSRLPKCEDYGLTSQMRRSALSISDNIAEAFGRHHAKDKMNFYYMSRGSLFELRNQLIYGARVSYFCDSDTANVHQNLENIVYELNSIIKSLNHKLSN